MYTKIPNSFGLACSVLLSPLYLQLWDIINGIRALRSEVQRHCPGSGSVLVACQGRRPYKRGGVCNIRIDKNKSV